VVVAIGNQSTTQTSLLGAEKAATCAKEDEEAETTEEDVNKALAAQFFDYDAPIISKITPAGSPVSGNLVAMIYGSNFGTSEHVDVTGEVESIRMYPSNAHLLNVFNRLSYTCLPGTADGPEPR
jgi:hypothetical protein